MTEFEKRIYSVLEKLNAPIDILQIVGSYKDTLSDEEVVSMVDDWLKGIPPIYKSEHVN